MVLYGEPRKKNPQTGKFLVFDANFFQLAAERRVTKGKTDSFYINRL